ncbi:hypothetical protein [Sphingomonas sp. TREG-RG-20F-R18-01]|uniref:hypothetical protein n=1 Tax=Sphingomonas sp. TREG-RG-20F-R18-01 TaxID=2914982 RepID=UPI001F5870F8|nr:hypothetical protein [Sphingomonas sp. TREG-RG-20F-R18-01]
MTAHPGLFALLDMASVGVPTIGLVVWQLVSINREIARDKTDRPEPSPERPGHAIGEHRLDDR